MYLIFTYSYTASARAEQIRSGEKEIGIRKYLSVSTKYAAQFCAKKQRAVDCGCSLQSGHILCLSCAVLLGVFRLVPCAVIKLFCFTLYIVRILYIARKSIL